MKDFGILAGAAALALAAGSAAFATDISDILPSGSDSLSVYEEVGEWTVWADNSRGSCLIERTDALGNGMQMGLTKDQSAVYVGVFTLANNVVKQDQPIEIAVDGQVYTGQVETIRSGKLSGNYSGGYVLSNNPDFVMAIANGRELVAFPEQTGLFVVDLTGTKRAIEEAKKCIAAERG